MPDHPTIENPTIGDLAALDEHEDTAELLAVAVAAAGSGNDPYPWLHQLTARADAVRGPTGIVYVAGYSVASELLRSNCLRKRGEHGSTAFATSAPATEPAPGTEPAPEDRPAPSCPVAMNVTPGWLTTIDDPDHGRIRRHVVRPFTARNVEVIREPAREILDRLLARIDVSEPCDLVAEIGFVLPSLVLDHMVGLSLGAHPGFAALADEHQRDREPTADAVDRAAAEQGRHEVFSIIRGMLASGTEPGSLTAELVASTLSQPPSLTNAELVTLLGQMYLAGFHAAAFLLANAVRALLTHPEQAAALHDEPKLAADAVIETLRYDTPVMTATYRATEPLDVGGLEVAPGGAISFLLGAANHDARVFSEPERFDIFRPQPAPVLSFSTGAHFCLASSLVQTEIEVVLAELFRRFPRMRLAEIPRRSPTFHLRGYPQLKVVLDH
jgi:hypothetical protein